MKKLLFILFALISLNAFSQIKVKEGSFHKIDGFLMLDKEDHRDINWKPMALIKISTEGMKAEERARLLFYGNLETYFDVVQMEAETYLYVSAQAATFIEIKHPDFGKTEFWLPEDLCDFCGYEMVVEYTPKTSGQTLGFLAVSSDPTEADIYVDGKHYGKTTKVITDLTEGKHELRIEKQGYATITKNVDITKGKTLEINERLQDINSQRTYLIIKADQTNAMIYIDDKPIGAGEASLSVMLGSTHTYKIEDNLYHTESGSVTINEKTIIEKQLRPAFGYLNVSTRPEQGAKVFVNGDYVGNSPVKTDKLKSGNYTVRVIKDNFNMTEKYFTVTDGQTTNATLDMSANFVNVTINTDSQSDIYVDDEYKGRGSWTGKLSDGNHAFEARKINHKPSKKNMNLMLGKDEIIILDSPMPITGSVDINSSPMGADIYIDNKHCGQTPNFINDVIIGHHELKLTKDGYSSITKNITIKEGEVLNLNEKMSDDASFTKQTEKVDKKTSVEKKTFVGLNLAYSVAPQMSYGLTFGQAGKIGWYVSAMSNFNFDAMGCEYECDMNGKIDGDIAFYTGETASTRVSVGGGVLYRIVKPIYLKAGLGYGFRDLAWQGTDGSWVKNAYYSNKGIELDAGLMLFLGKINASFDGLVNMGGENGPSLEFKLGLGLNF